MMARIGIVVGKKQIPTAVARNFVKRIIREVFRVQRQSLPALDYVIRVNKFVGANDASLVRNELSVFFQNI